MMPKTKYLREDLLKRLIIEVDEENRGKEVFYNLRKSLNLSQKDFVESMGVKKMSSGYYRKAENLGIKENCLTVLYFITFKYKHLLESIYLYN